MMVCLTLLNARSGHACQFCRIHLRTESPVTCISKQLTKRHQKLAAQVHQIASQADLRIYQLPIKELTPENFQAFGQVIGASYDGKEFDKEDAQLVLDKGTPRFYIMQLPRRGLSFDRITFHADVTQCLGSISLQPWYMAVAAPSGTVEDWPKPEDISAFRIPPGKFIKLHQGTWHAGPLFDGVDSMAFYNLELADTNVTDHNTHDYSEDNVMFVLNTVRDN